MKHEQRPQSERPPIVFWRWNGIPVSEVWQSTSVCFSLLLRLCWKDTKRSKRFIISVMSKIRACGGSYVISVTQERSKNINGLCKIEVVVEINIFQNVICVTRGYSRRVRTWRFWQSFQVNSRCCCCKDLGKGPCVSREHWELAQSTKVLGLTTGALVEIYGRPQWQPAFIL